VRSAAAIVLAALACGGGSGDGSVDGTAEVGGAVVEAPYGEPFELGIGERAVAAGEFRVTFERVVEDSRCPEGATCVQEGNAAAAFAVESDAGSATLTLHTGRQPRSASAMGGELRLVALGPRPHADAMIDSAAYVATLIVSPAP
jgi:hypothetical protein